MSTRFDLSKKESMRVAYGETLVRLGAKYKNIVVLDADLAKSTQTIRFGKKYPDRFFDMGIAEQDLISTAAGFAASGFNPFASTFAMFGSGRAWEQVRNSIAYPNLPVKIVLTHAGISVGEDGPTHQACEDIGLMRILPNMKIIAPADAVETEKVIEFLGDYYESPVYVRLARMTTPVVCDRKRKFKIGEGVFLTKGEDITVISTGIMIFEVLKAEEELKKEGIKIEVIHMPTIKPIDEKSIISSVTKTKKVITIEEHNIIGGLGSAVSEVLTSKVTDKIKIRHYRMGIRDMFAESGSPSALFKKYGLTYDYIIKNVKKLLKDK